VVVLIERRARIVVVIVFVIDVMRHRAISGESARGAIDHDNDNDNDKLDLSVIISTL
jgi:hypothetical protein